MLEKVQSLVVNNAARALRLPLQHLPFSLQKISLLSSLKLVFKDPLAEGEFAFLTDKWLKIEVRDLGLVWFISYQKEELIMTDQPQQEAVSFSGDLNDLILIAGRKEDPDTLFFQRRLKIEGDTELGLEVKNLMDSVDLQQLPKIVQLFIDQLAGFVQQGLSIKPALA